MEERQLRTMSTIWHGIMHKGKQRRGLSDANARSQATRAVTQFLLRSGMPTHLSTEPLQSLRQNRPVRSTTRTLMKVLMYLMAAMIIVRLAISVPSVPDDTDAMYASFSQRLGRNVRPAGQNSPNAATLRIKIIALLAAVATSLAAMVHSTAYRQAHAQIRMNLKVRNVEAEQHRAAVAYAMHLIDEQSVEIRNLRTKAAASRKALTDLGRTLHMRRQQRKLRTNALKQSLNTLRS